VTSNPGAVVSSAIARLDKGFNFEEIIDAGVSGSCKHVIAGGATWTECSSSLAIGTGLLRLCPDVGTILQIDGQSTMMIERKVV
jgi:hypothetical protein